MAWIVKDKKNIFGGAARLIVAETTQTKPTKFSDIFGTDWALATGYTDIGATDWGVKLSRSYDKEEWEVDQYLWVIDEFIKKWDMNLETSLAENSLENLQLAWNLWTATVNTDETPNEATAWIWSSTSVAEKMLILQVDKRTEAWVNYKRCYVFWRWHWDWSDVAQEYKKWEKVLLPIKFSLLQDPTETVDRWFGITIDQVYA